MHKVIQLISKILYKKNMSLSMTCSLGELDEKPKSNKKFKVLKFWRKRLQGKGIILKIIWKKHYVQCVLEMFSFWCKSHVQEIILSKKMFGCPLKFIVGFFTFLAINQSIDTQLCMHVKNHHHHKNYLKLNYSFLFP
jgi:hypothetical protein